MKGIKICLFCKKEFSPLRGNGRIYGKKQFQGIRYCSRSCAMRARGISKQQHKKMILARLAKGGYKGENSSNWKGGITTPESRKEYGKKWRKENLGKILYYGRKRRNKKLSVGGSHTFGEWELLKKQYNYTCPCCHSSLSETHVGILRCMNRNCPCDFSITLFF